MGMVLLLKDAQNLSSNNDIYRDKLDDYGCSNIIWNEILAGELPDVDTACLPRLSKMPLSELTIPVLFQKTKWKRGNDCSLKR